MKKLALPEKYIPGWTSNRETGRPSAILRTRSLLRDGFKYILRRCRVWATLGIRQLKRSRWRVLPSIFAAALNMLLLAVVVAGLRLPASPSSNEMHLVLAPLTRSETVSAPSLPDVELPAMQMPDIVIERDTSDPAPPALSASLVLAPRPDPAHPNPAPTGLSIDGQQHLSGSLILKILVQSDGTIADASVVRTSGRPDADEAAMNFIKAQWKLLPALLEGKPIQYWTTVVVRLS